MAKRICKNCIWYDAMSDNGMCELDGEFVAPSNSCDYYEEDSETEFIKNKKKGRYS